MIEFYESLTNTQKEIFMVIAESDSFVTAKDIYESLGGKRLESKRLYPSDKAFLDKLIELGYVMQSIEGRGRYIPKEEMGLFANHPYRLCAYFETIKEYQTFRNYVAQNTYWYV